MLQHSTDIESFDDLPNRSKIPKDSRRGYRGRAYRSTYPHNKVLRFLESRVGELWNDVYSEFCHLTWLPDGHKTKERLSWNVLFETVMQGGKVHFIEEGSGDIKPLEEHWINSSNLFYIHPVTQKLCKAPKKKQAEIKKPETVRILGDYHQLVKVKGIWYEVKGEKKDNKSNIIEKDGLQYRIIPDKDLPPIHERNFAWGKGKNAKDINYFASHYQIVDGHVVEPIRRGSSWRYERKTVGPRDVMIELNYNQQSFYYDKPDYDTVKVTLYKQLTSKELKRHNLKNDVQNLPNDKCPKCGGFNCILHKIKAEMNNRIW